MLAPQKRVVLSAVCYYVGLVCCFTLPGGGLQIVYFVHVPLFTVDLPLKVVLVVCQVVLILS